MKVHRNHLAAVMEGTASEKIHYSLQGVRFENDRMVATDGRILTIRSVKPNGTSHQPLVVDRAVLRKAVKKVTEAQFPEVTIEPKAKRKVSVEGTWETEVVDELEGTYPNYERVIVPKERRGQKVARFDPELMIKAMKTMAGCEHVTFSIVGPDKVARIDGQTKDGTKVMTLIMPMVDQ